MATRSRPKRSVSSTTTTSSAAIAREKDKKRDDKKKKTDPPSLHKEDKASKLDNASSEDKASVDSISLSLAGSSTGPEILPPVMPWSSAKSLKDDYLRMHFSNSLSMEERIERRRQVREENPGVSEDDFKAIYRTRLLEARKAQKSKEQDEKDSLLSSSLAEKKKEDELLVQRTSSESLPCGIQSLDHKEENSNLFEEVKNSNPDATAEELGKALRVAKLKAARVRRRMKMRDEKDSSLTLPLSHLGTVNSTSPLSLRAQPKSDASLEVNYSSSLTKEERALVFDATKLATPNANSGTFSKAYKTALWKADSLKRDINPGSNWKTVDFPPCSDTEDSEDSSGESSSSSEDGMQVIRKDLLRQKQVPSSTTPLENKYLAGLKQALDKDLLSLFSSL
jgi:hypothetical protein